MLLDGPGGWVAAVIAGYLVGSVPFGLLLTRAAGLGDIRKIGSGNIGATNVLRTGNKVLAAATLILDVAKGTIAVLVGAWLAGLEGALIAGISGFIGHCFPVWLGFKGGKGVATFIGILLGWAWPVAATFCIAWLTVAIVSRFSSLAALVASVIAPPLLAWFAPHPLAPFAGALLTAMLFWRHRSNITRLREGTESRIGQSS